MLSNLKSKFKAAKNSITMWINGMVITLVSFSDAIPDLAPLMRDFLPEDVWKYLGYYAALMIIIRFRNVDKTNYNRIKESN